MIRLACVAVVLLFTAACSTSEHALTTTAPSEFNLYACLGIPLADGKPDLSSVEITLQRTWCFGSCPVYTVELDGTGKVTYTGEWYVKTKGERSANVARESVLLLLDQFESLDFMDFEHQCDWYVADTPKPTVKLRVGSREHSFTELTGGCYFPEDDAHSRAHLAAVELMAAIDHVCRIEQWTGSCEERRQNAGSYR